MSIDEIIKYLPAPICGDTVIGNEKQKEYDAHDSAIIILRKYQKIQKIMAKRPKDMISSNPTLRAISEVLEDGKID